jgi:hypothetical protein
MTDPVQTGEQPEMLGPAAKRLAWRHQNALGDRRSNPRREVPLENSVVTA